MGDAASRRSMLNKPPHVSVAKVRQVKFNLIKCYSTKGEGIIFPNVAITLKILEELVILIVDYFPDSLMTNRITDGLLCYQSLPVYSGLKLLSFRCLLCVFEQCTCPRVSMCGRCMVVYRVLIETFFTFTYWEKKEKTTRGLQAIFYWAGHSENGRVELNWHPIISQPPCQMSTGNGLQIPVTRTPLELHHSSGISLSWPPRSPQDPT